MSSAEPSERAEQVLDRGEVVAVALELLDHREARDVLGPVVARPRPHLGRREQPARLVGADVAHGHAAGAGELVDRHRAGLASSRREGVRGTRSILRRYM